MSVSPLHLPPGVQWIDSARALAEALPDLRQAPDLALDTEADSYYVYRVKVCLLQISTAERDYLIDPLAGVDLAPIAELMADRSIRKVFHAGANDVALLKHHHGFEFANLFDTMIAAQVLGLRRPGLAALLQERFGVEQKKTYQTSDWGKRPLSAGQLEYAAGDTRYLLKLRDQLKEELVAKGRLEEALEDFEKLVDVGHTERVFDPDSFRRAPGADRLDPVALRVLHDLFELRDQIATRRDRSPHRVFPDHALVEVAKRRPRSASGLYQIPGLPRWQVDRDERALLETIARAASAGPVPRERSRRSRGLDGEPPLREEERRVFEALREWRRKRAAERAVEESRVATTGTLRQIARAEALDLERLAALPGMSPFRVREYGGEIVRLVADVRAAKG
jgi:ribonuclease D